MPASYSHTKKALATKPCLQQKTFSLIASFLVVASAVLYFSDLTSGRPLATTAPTKLSQAEELAAGVFRVDLNQPSDPRFDPVRGWMLDPIEAMSLFSIKGGAESCVSLHVGIVMPGALRGNHRHHYGNETMLLWGGRTRLRLENPATAIGYSEFIMERTEVIIAAGPQSMAHSIENLDDSMYTNIAACMDDTFDKNNPRSDYKVWPDLAARQ